MTVRIYVVWRYYPDADPKPLRAFETLQGAQAWADEQPWSPDVGIESYAVGRDGIELESYRSWEIGKWVVA